MERIGFNFTCSDDELTCFVVSQEGDSSIPVKDYEPISLRELTTYLPLDSDYFYEYECIFESDNETTIEVRMLALYGDSDEFKHVGKAEFNVEIGNGGKAIVSYLEERP